MEFTCNRSEFYEVLGNVQSVIPSRSAHPVLANVLITADEKRVRILGTDMDVTMEGIIDSEVKSSGSYALPAKKLFELMREFGPGDIEFSREGNRIKLVQGFGRFSVSGVEREDFPHDDLMKEGDKKFSITVKDMKRMLDKTGYSISVDVARIALSGLLVKFTSNSAIAVATDGHRLTMLKKEIDIQNGESGDVEILIPAKTVGYLGKMLGESDGVMEITIGAGTVRFAVGGYVLTSKLITERFPNFEQVIPKDNTKALIAEKKSFLSAAKRAAVMSNPLTHLIKMDIEENKVELSSSDYDVGGEAFEKVIVEYNEDPMKIGFNSTYLLEILRHLDSEEVKFLMKNTLSSALIMPLPQEEGEEYLSILMPLRLPEEEG
ncbi:MAG: DNA polymerase III subunit beta [bacterium]